MLFKTIVLALTASICCGQSLDALLQRLDSVERDLQWSLSHLAANTATLDELGLQIQALSDMAEELDIGEPSLLQKVVSHQVEEYKDYVEYMNIPIAFSASAATPQSVGDGGTVIFGDVITNVGLNYNPSSGEFLAPYTGLYMFTTTLYATTSNMYGGTIMAGSTPLIHAYACDPLRDDQSTAIVFAIVNVDDLVYVEAGEVIGSLEGSTDRLSTFSGTLILRL